MFPSAAIVNDGAATSAEATEHKVLGNGECDCTPLWECINTPGSDCSQLDRDLKACLAAHKLA